jgi:hypothetical protein
MAASLKAIYLYLPLATQGGFFESNSNIDVPVEPTLMKLLDVVEDFLQALRELFVAVITEKRLAHALRELLSWVFRGLSNFCATAQACKAICHDISFLQLTGPAYREDTYPTST